MIFLKCKIRFIYVGFNCKRKKWGKKMSGNFAIKGGGVGPLMANAILNFHFDFLTTSLTWNSLSFCQNHDAVFMEKITIGVYLSRFGVNQ